MTKIGIILFSNLRYCPYVGFYTNIIKSIPNVKYDLIYLNRNRSLCEEEDEHHIPIRWHLKHSKFSKIINFILYTRQTTKVLKDNKYDKLIILTTFPGILLYSFIKKRYVKQYIFDIRDFTYENRTIFKKIESKVIEIAACTVISSPDYKNFLPKSEYLICHNLSEKITLTCEKKFQLKNKSSHIIISYIGTIAYIEQCKRMCDLVAGDERFSFLLYGNEIHEKKLSTYVQHKACSRIKMMGAFLPDDKERIYMESDLVFNCYGSECMTVKYALSNKLYDGAFYKRPLIVSPNTSMQKMGEGCIYALDLTSADSLDDLYKWYMSFDRKKYYISANKIICDSLVDNAQTRKHIYDFIIK